MKLIFILLVVSLFSCTLFNDKTNKEGINMHNLPRKKSIACDSIRKLISIWENDDHSNYHLNEIVEFLEQESKIKSTCDKGTYGYLYSLHSDAIFYSDVKKWRKYFKCE